MDDMRAVYEAILRAHDEGQSVAVATIITTVGSMPRHAGSKMLIHEDGTFVGTVGGGAMESRVIQAGQEVIARGEARTETYSLNDLADGDPGICGGTATIFIEPLLSPPTLLVIGGGHVGQAVAKLGLWMGYRVILSDDRPAYCNADVVPGLHGYVVSTPSELVQQVSITKRTYVAAVTRGLPIDTQWIPAMLATEAAYIGLIGSRRRWALTMRQLRDAFGLSAEQLQRIHAPIGLELEAETPREIALSILAEITMVRRGGTGRPMRWMGTVDDANEEELNE